MNDDQAFLKRAQWLARLIAFVMNHYATVLVVLVACVVFTMFATFLEIVLPPIVSFACALIITVALAVFGLVGMANITIEEAEQDEKNSSL